MKYKEIIVATIGLFASVSAAWITAGKTSEAAIEEERNRMSGGTISADSRIISRIGRTFSVNKEDQSNYKIVFDKPFDRTPIALTTTYQDGSPTTARIKFVDERSVVVTTRMNTTDNPTPDTFSFMVLESLSK